VVFLRSQSVWASVRRLYLVASHGVQVLSAVCTFDSVKNWPGGHVVFLTVHDAKLLPARVNLVLSLHGVQVLSMVWQFRSVKLAREQTVVLTVHAVNVLAAPVHLVLSLHARHVAS